MKQYDVVFTIRSSMPVEANTVDEAAKIANEYVQEFDFGKLKDIDWDIDCIVDDDEVRKHFRL